MSDEQTKILSNGDDKLDRIIEMLRQQSLNIEDMNSRLTSLEIKVDERLRDTRPLWEGVQEQLSDIKSDIRKIDRKIGVIHDDILNVKVDLADVEKRLDKVEQKPS